MPGRQTRSPADPQHDGGDWAEPGRPVSARAPRRGREPSCGPALSARLRFPRGLIPGTQVQRPVPRHKRTTSKAEGQLSVRNTGDRRTGVGLARVPSRPEDTTRDPRPGEENGKDYYFVTREVMQRDIIAGDFIEHAEFSGNLYGTSKAAVQAVQAMNRICVLDVDLQGVRNIKKTDLRPIYISVQPPSLDVLEQRLRQRNTETEESLAKRLAAARADMDSSKEPGLFDLLIINDNLDKAYAALKEALSEEIRKAQGTSHA